MANCVNNLSCDSMVKTELEDILYLSLKFNFFAFLRFHYLTLNVFILYKEDSTVGRGYFGNLSLKVAANLLKS